MLQSKAKTGCIDNKADNCFLGDKDCSAICSAHLYTFLANRTEAAHVGSRAYPRPSNRFTAFSTTPYHRYLEFKRHSECNSPCFQIQITHSVALESPYTTLLISEPQYLRASISEQASSSSLHSPNTHPPPLSTTFFAHNHEQLPSKTTTPTRHFVLQ